MMLVLSLGMAVSFSSCSSDSDDGDGGNGGKIKGANDLIGGLWVSERLMGSDDEMRMTWEFISKNTCIRSAITYNHLDRYIGTPTPIKGHDGWYRWDWQVNNYSYTVVGDKVLIGQGEFVLSINNDALYESNSPDVYRKWK